MFKFFLTVFIIVLLELAGHSFEMESAESNAVLGYSSVEISHQTQRKSRLRIYARNYPPIMSIIANPKSERVEYHGLSVDLAEYLAQYLDLKIEYIPEKLSDLQTYGPVQVVINALMNKEVDMVLTGLTPSSGLMEKIDMTSPVIYDDFKIMVKWPEEMDRWNEVARPFDKTTWSMIAASFSVLIGFMTLFILVYGQYSRNLIINILSDNFLYVIAITANQGQLATGISRFSLRIMLGFWLLMMVVLINAYTGTLTSRMTAPKLKPIPQSLEELAHMNEEYQITIMDKYLLANSILNASSGTYKILGDTLREHPKLLFKEYSEVTDIVLEHNGANVESSVVISFRIVNDFKLHGKCRMTASDPISHVQSVSPALTKDSPFTKIVDTCTRRALEIGLFEVWKKNNVPSMDRCKLQNQDRDRKPTPITVVQLSSAFVVLGIGLAFALFSFLIEMIVSSLLITQTIF